ncbi:uncharacterized protein G2W53_017484 [Senna tora]|uniref:Uncharacterized protein n=1 Tax=Senna tora TaxID=362788 RepID=A0A834TQG6_9FABA|nr:uncharacterized protein G2W53_017484 [Senna tora]
MLGDKIFVILLESLPKFWISYPQLLNWDLATALGGIHRIIACTTSNMVNSTRIEVTMLQSQWSDIQILILLTVFNNSSCKLRCKSCNKRLREINSWVILLMSEHSFLVSYYISLPGGCFALLMCPCYEGEIETKGRIEAIFDYGLHIFFIMIPLLLQIFAFGHMETYSINIFIEVVITFIFYLGIYKFSSIMVVRVVYYKKLVQTPDLLTESVIGGTKQTICVAVIAARSAQEVNLILIELCSGCFKKCADTEASGRRQRKMKLVCAGKEKQKLEFTLGGPTIQYHKDLLQNIEENEEIDVAPLSIIPLILKGQNMTKNIVPMWVQENLNALELVLIVMQVLRKHGVVGKLASL